jgi:hypothetical protein
LSLLKNTSTNSISSMEKNLSELICTFDPITLEEMDSVKLFDRIDTKFIFSYNQLPGILQGLSEHYRLLNVNGIKKNRYETLYFDTPDYKLYLDHHNEKPNRYKVRYRKYVDSDLVFFEVKHKDGKGRTLKSRVKRNKINEQIEGSCTQLINEKTSLNPDELQSNLWVTYTRMTFVKKSGTERLTLDLNLTFKKGMQEISYNNLVIAEVKQEKLGDSPFINVMRLNQVPEGSISKYCFGVVSLVDSIKKNNFKSYLSTLNKLCNEPNVQIPA